MKCYLNDWKYFRKITATKTTNYNVALNCWILRCLKLPLRLATLSKLSWSVFLLKQHNCSCLVKVKIKSCKIFEISQLSFVASVCSLGSKVWFRHLVSEQTNFCHIRCLRFQNNRHPSLKPQTHFQMSSSFSFSE